MLDLLSKTWKLLLLPLIALAFFLGAYFFFYRGGQDRPLRADIPFKEIAAPSSSFSSLTTEVPLLQKGMLLVDGAHGNDFTKAEVSLLLSRVADRGYAVEFIGEATFFGGFRSLGFGERFSKLEEKLRRADSLAVIIPRDTYSSEEVDIIERFVQKGGKLLLIADPSRDHQINSLAERFGIAFQPDYLYNSVEHDLNFQNIFVRNFRPDEITRGLGQIVLYTAGSIKSSGPGLAFTDGNTRSSILERPELLYPLVKGSDSHVLAVSDFTFMVPPQNSILDNDKLVSNIADYLTASDRKFELADFPHFFKGEVDILLGRSPLLEVGTELKNMLLSFQIGSEIRGVEDLTRDTVYLGLYGDVPNVAQYLDFAGIQVDGAVRTPFTPDLPPKGTAIMLLHTSQKRHVMVILGDSPEALRSIVGRLRSGDFRRGLVGDFVGVFRSP